ncbi:MAG: hypothetical protein Q9227_008647 [Pyrenula ochraceoflavens]
MAQRPTISDEFRDFLESQGMIPANMSQKTLLNISRQRHVDQKDRRERVTRDLQKIISPGYRRLPTPRNTFAVGVILETRESTLELLPSECVYRIIQYLDYQSGLNLIRVSSKLFKKACKDFPFVRGQWRDERNDWFYYELALKIIQSKCIYAVGYDTIARLREDCKGGSKKSKEIAQRANAMADQITKKPQQTSYW